MFSDLFTIYDRVDIPPNGKGSVLDSKGGS